MDSGAFHTSEGPPQKKLKSDVEKKCVKIGIPMPPSDAVRRAREAMHPFDEATQVSEAVMRVMSMSVDMGIEYVHQKRVAVLRKIKARATALEESEKKLRDMMPAEVVSIYEGKKFLLLQELLVEVDYQDKNLVNDLVQGMR